MGIKPAQGELNMALRPIFASIDNAHLIHDDLLIATETEDQHAQTLDRVMQAVKQAGLTLNPTKCYFVQKEILFWGMNFGADGVKPVPAKVEALEHVSPPKNREELVSFLCMMQSNAEFVPCFAKKSAPLRELTKSKVRFRWNSEHQSCFELLLQEFKKDTLLRYFDMKKDIYILTDAHITGLGSMLGQKDDKQIIRPVVFASRTTKPAEGRYPQLDLEGLGIDFGLRRFRNYIVGAPNPITVVTDHKPLCSIFNGNKSGSIRTERIKMRHQDIKFIVTYVKGKLNQVDFVSRRAKDIQLIPKDEQDESEDLNNLLYMLHTTPVIDHIGIAEIARATMEDDTLQQVTELVKEGRTWLHKSADSKLKKFASILPEITYAGNGVLFKGERIILPESLHQTAIELAHRGSHPGQNGMERRLRYHFFFHDMLPKVKSFVQTCQQCSIFTDKKTQHTLQHHQVPSKCWEAVAVDLFEPMPSSKHIVVVQDLASRFPAAKLVPSTSAGKVVPALSDIYNAYGNPETQLSDNGPPFNSKAMDEFAKGRGITLQKIPPLHPSSNPAETFMKSVGKAMKTAHFSKMPEHNALELLLQNYRGTPHPATGLAPADMLFRDGMCNSFPRRDISYLQVQEARGRDIKRKAERDSSINSSKYRQDTNLAVGDYVLLRNHQKTKKFEPIFLPEPFQVINTSKDGRVITIQKDNQTFKRHPDDLKPFQGILKPEVTTKNPQHRDTARSCQHWHTYEEDDYDDNISVNDQDDEPTTTLRRSARTRVPNPRYNNETFVK